MKTLYLKLIELLADIEELKYVDINVGQLQMEKPPVSFPAVLININAQTTDDIQDTFQILTGNFELTICTKIFSESNNLAPEAVRVEALKYFELSDKIYKKLQGYQDSKFESFSRKSAKEQNLRKGLKTVVQNFETSWREFAN